VIKKIPVAHTKHQGKYLQNTLVAYKEQRDNLKESGEQYRMKKVKKKEIVFVFKKELTAT